MEGEFPCQIEISTIVQTKCDEIPTTFKENIIYIFSRINYKTLSSCVLKIINGCFVIFVRLKICIDLKGEKEKNIIFVENIENSENSSL